MVTGGEGVDTERWIQRDSSGRVKGVKLNKRGIWVSRCSLVKKRVGGGKGVRARCAKCSTLAEPPRAERASTDLELHQTTDFEPPDSLRLAVSSFSSSSALGLSFSRRCIHPSRRTDSPSHSKQLHLVLRLPDWTSWLRPHHPQGLPSQDSVHWLGMLAIRLHLPREGLDGGQGPVQDAAGEGVSQFAPGRKGGEAGESVSALKLKSRGC